MKALKKEYDFIKPLNLKIVKSGSKKKKPEDFTIFKLIRIIAYSLLVFAFIYGRFLNNADYQYLINQKTNIAQIESIGEDEKTFRLVQDSSLIRLRETQGYGGPLLVGLQSNQEGIITDVHVLKERETFSFMEKLRNKKFFEQFIGEKISDPLKVGIDIDAVSGCTVSSVAFTKAIQNSGHSLANDFFDAEIKAELKPWKTSYADFAVLALIILEIASIYLKKKWLRYASLTFSFFILGFYLNASVSIAHFGRLFLGYFPDIHDHIVWWILMVISLFFVLFLRKNIYCSNLCPFHAAETALIKISGFKFKLNRKFQQYAKYTSSILLWIALMIIFFSANPTLGSYEPFALLFSLDGAGIQWYLLPVALIGAFFVPEFYCRYFCPVGRMFKYLIKFSNWLAKKLKISIK